MLKKKLSKKKNLLMVLWDDSIAFRVLFFILAYLVLGFINMPFEKWLEAHSTEWRSTETPHYFFLQGLTHEKANFIEHSFFFLPIFEAIAVALICFIIYGLFYSVSKMIAFRNYCYIPLTEDEVKKWNLKMQMNILLMFLTCFLMVSKRKKISMLVMRNLKRCL